MRDRCRRKRRSGPETDSSNPVSYLTFGDCRTVLQDNSNYGLVAASGHGKEHKCLLLWCRWLYHDWFVLSRALAPARSLVIGLAMAKTPAALCRFSRILSTCASIAPLLYLLFFLFFFFFEEGKKKKKRRGWGKEKFWGGSPPPPPFRRV